jgi:hypothetical protein
MWRARVPLILAACLTVLLCVSAPQALAGTAPSPKPPGVRAVIVRVLGSGGWRPMPVRGGRVSVVVDGRVAAKGRVGSRGMAMLGHFRRLPREFQVIIDGGRIGHRRLGGSMLADVHGYRRGQTVHVDFVTTLVAGYRMAYPGLSPRKARHTVRRFLRLPAYYEIGIDGRSNVAFDGRRFLARSGTGARYRHFVDKLVRKMHDPRERMSFARARKSGKGQRRQKSSTRALSLGVGRRGSGLDRARPVGASQGNLAEAIVKGTGIFGVLGNSVNLLEIAEGGLAIYDAVEAAETRAELEQISAQLQEVEQSIALLQETVEKMRREGHEENYSARAAEVAETRAEVKSAADSLASATETSIQENCTSPSVPHGPKCAEIQGLLMGPDGFSYNMAATGLTTPAAVNAYALRIAGDALGEEAAPGELGLIQLASRLVTEEPTFFTPTDSTRLRAASAYWISSYTEALSLAATYWALNGANKLTLETDIGQVKGNAAAMPKAIPSELKEATVSTADGRMWSIEAAGAGTTETPFAKLSAAQWEFEPKAEEWQSANGLSLKLLGAGKGEFGFSNWKIAGLPQLAGLREVVAERQEGSAGPELIEKAEFSEAMLRPKYSYTYQGETATGRGVNIIFYAYPLEIGCEGSKYPCVWPVLIGDETISGFNQPLGVWEEAAYRPHPWYVEECEEGCKVPRWGYAPGYGETLYGADPIASIPYLFYREVGNNECYYYPAPGVPKAGSPGCAE